MDCLGDRGKQMFKRILDKKDIKLIKKSLKRQFKLVYKLNTDLVEITAHSGARPNHAKWQGKVFSLSGKHPKYPSFYESTGYGTDEGLGCAGCRHSFFPFFEGMSPTYTQAELDEMNARKFLLFGEMLTEYEASQKQRECEWHLRKLKQEYIDLARKRMPTIDVSFRLSYWQRRLNFIIKQTGFKRDYSQERVEGYGRSEAAKVRAQSRLKQKTPPTH